MGVSSAITAFSTLGYRPNSLQLPKLILTSRGQVIGNTTGDSQVCDFRVVPNTGARSTLLYGLWRTLLSMNNTNQRSWTVTPINFHPLGIDTAELAGTVGFCGQTQADNVASKPSSRDIDQKLFLGQPQPNSIASVQVATENINSMTMVAFIYLCAWTSDVWDYGGPAWPLIAN